MNVLEIGKGEFLRRVVKLQDFPRIWGRRIDKFLDSSLLPDSAISFILPPERVAYKQALR